MTDWPTTTRCSSYSYSIVQLIHRIIKHSTWKHDRHAHPTKAGSQFDWDGKDGIHIWCFHKAQGSLNLWPQGARAKMVLPSIGRTSWHIAGSHLPVLCPSGATEGISSADSQVSAAERRQTSAKGTGEKWEIMVSKNIQCFAEGFCIHASS